MIKDIDKLIIHLWLILFVGLKLMLWISWSWWRIFAPFIVLVFLVGFARTYRDLRKGEKK